jgi:glycerophosphoryl diester phosphodiesterase
MWSRRTRWVALLALLTLAAPAVAFAESPPVISPHRALGLSGFAENSLAAFEAAAKTGETDIEGDVFVTKDLAFVLSHDSPLRAPRCSGPYLDRSLRTLTAAQVAAMTCGGQPVARLDAVLAAVRPYPAATVRIEVKNEVADTSAQRTADAVRLARLFASTGWTARSIIQDFDWASTTGPMRTASPTQRVSALSGGITVAQVASARSSGVTDFSYAQAGATGFWNQLIAARGLTSTVWTVDQPLRARVLRAEGVGTIITDVPDTLRATLDDPGSQCTLAQYVRRTVTRGTGLAAGASQYRTLPALTPDGRVVEKELLRVRASTTAGTATLRISPKGTPAGSQWEQVVAVGPLGTTGTLEVAGGDGGGVRILNASTRAVRLEVATVGGTAWSCP